MINNLEVVVYKENNKDSKNSQLKKVKNRKIKFNVQRLKSNEYAVTLISLVITIIIMLILASIVIGLVMKNNGIIRRAQNVVQKTTQMQAREKLEIALLYLQEEKVTNLEYNEKDYIDKHLQNEKMIVIGDLVIVDGWKFSIDRSIPAVKTEERIDSEGIIQKISQIIDDGYYTMKVKGKVEEGIIKEENYSLHVIQYNETLVLDGIKEVKGATLFENIYEFGDKNTDVAVKKENTEQIKDAQNMVVLKVNGDLVINEGITLTTCKSDAGYGGPKGLLIYCTGTITNNGTISMTQRGAMAEGQDVYLWENMIVNDDKDGIGGKYEYIPKDGVEGANSYATSSATYQVVYPNIVGAEGKGRKTAGGASGGAGKIGRNFSAIGGKGGQGTSYSGGGGRRRNCNKRLLYSS